MHLYLQDVEELIRIALHRYSSDRIAKFDFALENSGGSVIKNSESYPPSLETFSVMGVPVWSVPCSPTAIIRVSLLPPLPFSSFYLLSLPPSLPPSFFLLPPPSFLLPPSLPLSFFFLPPSLLPSLPLSSFSLPLYLSSSFFSLPPSLLFTPLHLLIHVRLASCTLFSSLVYILVTAGQ